MNRIHQKFEQLAGDGKKALVPYITPEFPFRGITVPLLSELEQSGADMIELGIPFSDPLADGPTIQHSSEIAIKNGASIPTIFSVVREFRKKGEVPILLMGYINPILRFGIERFVKECSAAGVDGLIVPDLPPEEASALQQASSKASVSNVFLIAPTTTDDRMQKIDAHSTDFSYCVSVTGVTGARAQLGSNGAFDGFLERVKKNVRKKFVVGFGISTVEQVARVWRIADGAVVGSALLSTIGKTASSQEAVAAAGRFIKSLRPSTAR
ncbi:MAG: tryptophan synthase subunit alpha [Bacteroidota bacterium]